MQSNQPRTYGPNTRHLSASKSGRIDKAGPKIIAGETTKRLCPWLREPTNTAKKGLIGQ